MGLFDRFTNKVSPKEHEALKKELRDLRLAVGGLKQESEQINQAIKQRRKTLAKPLHYANPVASAAFDRAKDGRMYHGPVHDLAEVARAMDVEAYVNQSVRKHREQILKEGFRITGQDEEMVEYIHRRIFEMEMASDTIFEEIVRDFSTSLVAFGTSFLVKKRDTERSSGRKTMMHGKTLDPIAAIYHMDPTSVSAKVNDLGHVVAWKQKVDEAIGHKKEITFSSSDVVAAVVDRKPGFIFGTPYIIPVLDDIRALRKLEELAELAAQKYVFPGVHWKVGTDLHPAQELEDGSTEVDIVRVEVENQTPQGGIVTSHRVEHEVVGAAGQVLDLDPSIKYFEQRVLGGLRLSPVDLGRGDVSKASAGSVSKSLQESSKDFQAIIQAKITYELFVPLLMEGGFDVTNENLVRLEFTMIDREEERANQQHGMDLCNNSVITCTEYRRDYLGKKALEEGEIEDTKDDMKHQRDLELQKEQGKIAAQKTASSGGTSKNNSAARSVSNKVRPQNQSGKKAIKTSITANNNFEDAKAVYSVEAQSRMLVFKAQLEKAVQDSVENEDAFADLFSAYVESLSGYAKAHLGSVISAGVKDAKEQLGSDSEYDIPNRTVDRFFKNYVHKTLRKTSETSLRYMLDNKEKFLDSKVGISVLFTQLEEDVRYLTDRQIDIAYRFGFVRALRANGIQSFDFHPVESAACDDCIEKGKLNVSLSEKDLPYNLLLRTHDSCAFVVTLPEESSSGKTNE